ncbi:hypothetical protein DRJ17_03530 [Candidatus Woesearchaeota archaeon]|nr:MAG: hypothetical protein DRJ17_03530 [Candidatus Woesearchaeota archaeon]
MKRNKKNGTKVITRVLRSVAGIFIGISILIYLLSKVGIREIYDKSVHVNVSFLIVGLVLLFLGYFLQGLRWYILVSDRYKVTYEHSLMSVFAGLFLNQIIPLNLGFFAKPLLMKTKYKKASLMFLIQTTIFEIFLNIIVILILILPLLSIYYKQIFERASWWILIILLIILAVWLKRKFVIRMLKKISKIRFNITTVKAVLISFLIFINQVVIYYFVVRAFSIELNFFYISFAALVTLLCSFLVFVPAGIGIRDGVFMYLLMREGIEMSLGLSVSLSVTIAHIVYLSLIGGMIFTIGFDIPLKRIISQVKNKLLKQKTI